MNYWASSYSLPTAPTDAAGNAITSTTLPGSSNITGISVTSTTDVAPFVSGFSSTTADGSYGVGDVITITATMSEIVASGSTFNATLSTGDVVTLTAAAQGTSLSGSYTVGSGDSSADLSVTAYSVGSVNDVDGTANAMVSTALPTGNNLADNKAIVIDTTAPTGHALALASDTGSSASDGVSSAGTVTVSGIESGATWEYSTNSGSSWSAGSGSSFTLAAGSYAVGAVQVRQTDVAGNVSSAASNAAAWSIDTTSPTAPAFTGASLVTSDSTPAIAGTAEASSVVTIYDATGNVVGSATADGSGAWTATLSTLTSSTSLTATSTDAAGNVSSASSALVVTLDTAAPFVSAFSTSTPNGSYNAGDVINITATMSEAVTGNLVVVLDTGDSVTLSTGTASTTLSGSYTVGSGDTASDLTVSSISSASAADSVGNVASTAMPAVTNNVAANHAIVIDTTAPTLTAFSSSNPAATYGTGSVINLSATTSESVAAGASIVATLSNSQVVTLSTASTGTTLSGSYTVTGSDSGALTVSSYVLGSAPTDAAGNAMSSTTMPTTNLSGITLTNTDVAPFVIAFSSSTADGAYNAGDVINISATMSETIASGSSFNVTLSTGDVVALTAATQGTSLSGSYTVGAGDTAADLSVTAYSVGSVNDVDGTATPMASTALPTGNNLADNKAIVIDTTAPTTPVLVSVAGTNGSPNGAKTNDATPTISGTAEAASTVTLFEDLNSNSAFDSGESLGSAITDSTGNWSVTSSSLSSGTHAIRAIATDAAGNVSSVGGSGSLTVDTAAPTLSAFSATAGTYAAYSTITVSATASEGLRAGSAVRATLSNGDTVDLAVASEGATTLSGDYVVPANASSTTLTVTSFTALSATDAAGNALADQAAFSGTNLSGVSLATPSVSTFEVLAGTAANAYQAAYSEGDGSLFFTISRTGDTSTQQVVSYNFSGAAANSGDVLGNLSGTVTFAATDTTKVVSLGIVNDAILEIPTAETISLTVSSVSGSGTTVIATPTASVTINDNEMTSFWIEGPSTNVTEGTSAVFTVHRSGFTDTTATVAYEVNGTSASAADLSSGYSSGVVTFAPGATSATISIAVATDATIEPNEQFYVSLLNPDSGSASVPSTISNATIITNNITTTENKAVAVISDGSTAQFSVVADFATVSNNVSYNTIDEGTVATYTITRSGDTSLSADVVYSVSGGTAAQGTDYSNSGSTIHFNAGDTSKTVSVLINNDSLVETNETFNLTLASVSNSTNNVFISSPSSVTTTIIDNDQMSWSVASNASTVNEDASTASFTVSRAGNISTSATITLQTSGGSATSGSDYTALSTTLSFAANETEKIIPVTLINDTTAEGNETVSVVLTNPSSGNVTSGTASTTIIDNDQVNWSIASNGNVYENTNTADFTISRTGDSSQSATITFQTAGGTASASSDYTPVTTTVTFQAYETSKVVSANLINDNSPESSETITTAILSPSVGSISTGSAITSIIDDDSTLWSFSSTGNVLESAGAITYQVSRSGDLSQSATITVQTTGGTASANGVDYTGINTVLTFNANESTQTVTVNVVNDVLAEGAESVIAVVSNASSGTIGVATSATSTTSILDDDSVVWSIAANSNVTESSGFASWTVSRSGDTSLAGTIKFVPAWTGTATPGDDYAEPSVQTLSFAAGETSRVVSIALTDDTLGETSETIMAAIADPSSGYISGGAASITITDNDVSRSSFSVSPLWLGTTNAVYESSGKLVFVVTRSGDLSQTETVDYYTLDSTAVAGVDYTAASGTLTFTQGQTQAQVSVSLTNDGVLDSVNALTGASTEYFSLVLQNASRGNLVTNSATGTILDDQGSTAAAVPYAISVVTNNAYESDGVAAFTITRSGNTALAATSYFRTADGTATAGSDYTAVTQTLSWSPFETTKTVTVPLLTDALTESTETFVAEIASDSNFDVDRVSTAFYIQDTASTAATYSISGNTTAEDNGAATWTLTRSGDTTTTAVVYFRTTSGGTATAGSDYTDISSTALTWSVGETTKVLWTAVVADTLTEANETLTGQIATDVGFTTGLLSSNATLRDDDLWTATAASNDVITTGTASGTYMGGLLINTADGSDTVTVANTQTALSSIDLGSGSDILNTGTTTTNFIVAGAHYTGGTGVDTLQIGNTTSSWTFATSTSTGDRLTGFEILDLSTSVLASTVNLSLPDVLEMTSGNTVARTLRVEGTALDTLNLQVAGKTLQTPANGSSITDVDGATYTVVTSAAGSANANDVTIGAQTYDVIQYNTDSGLVTMLVDTDLYKATAYTITVNYLNNALISQGDDTWTKSALLENAGTVENVFTIIRTGSEFGAGVSYFRFADSTAVAGSDYVAATQTLSWAAGETVKQVGVTVLDDSTSENHEKFIPQISADPTFTTGVTQLTIFGTAAGFTIVDDDLWTGTSAGETLTTGVANAGIGYTGARVIDTADGADAVTLGAYASENTAINLGDGDDTLTMSMYAHLAGGAITSITGPQYVGGSGVDTWYLSGSGTTVDTSPAHPADMFSGFEKIYLNNLNMNTSLSFLFELTQGAAVANTVQVDGLSGRLFSLNQQGYNRGTAVAGSSVTGVDGNSYLVSASAAGSSDANDVTIGGQTYDVFTFATAEGTFTLLESTILTTINYAVSLNQSQNGDATIGSTGVGYYFYSGGYAPEANNVSVQPFRVTRSGDTSGTSVSYFQTYGGTATAGSDYVAMSTTLSWAVGESTKTISLTLLGDTVTEGSETVIAGVYSDAGFTTLLSSNTLTIADDDAWVATAGVANTITIGTASGDGYAGGQNIDTGDMNDSVSFGEVAFPDAVINLGAGDDSLSCQYAGVMMSEATTYPAGGKTFQYIGGSGVDSLNIWGAQPYDFPSQHVNAVTGFEIINILGGNTPVYLDLTGLLEFTTGNDAIVARELRIATPATSFSGSGGLTLSQEGLTMSTVAAGQTINDVTSTTGSPVSYTVVSSTLGNASANDVVIGGQTYDIYQYNTTSGLATLLVDTDIPVTLLA